MYTTRRNAGDCLILQKSSNLALGLCAVLLERSWLQRVHMHCIGEENTGWHVDVLVMVP